MTDRYIKGLLDNVNDDGILEYAPSGTGAVATTVERKLREWVSVFDFMTAAQIADVQSGSATIDVTTAIQAALNYQGLIAKSFQTTEGLFLGTAPTVFFPKGRYLISATLNGITDYAIIEGEEASLKKAAVFTGQSAFQMAGNAWRVYITGLQFENFENGIYLDSNNQNSGQIVINECGFFGCTNRAIWLDCQSSKTTIKNCIWRSNRYDLYVETGDLVVVDGGWISRQDNKAVNNSDGYIVNFGEKLVLRNVLCVPPATETATEIAWILNYKSVDCDGVRFGGESSGRTAINNAANGSPFGTQTQKYNVSIRNCELYSGTSTPAVRLYFVPNAIILENNMGLTASGSSAIAWSPSVNASTQAARLPALGTPESRWFFIHCRNNNGQDAVVDLNLREYATTNQQIRFASDSASGRNVIFDFLSANIVANDVYGTIEWKGYDGSTVTGRRGAIIGRAKASGGGLQIVFQTGADFGANADRVIIDDRGQLLVGTSTASAGAFAEFTSTEGALVVPRMTTAQRDALGAVVNGAVIYNTTTNKMNFREAGAWVQPTVTAA